MGTETKYGTSSNDSIVGHEYKSVLGITTDNGVDIIFGYDGDDLLKGLSGNDKLYGGNGHDNLDGGSDKDLLEGGAGNDYLDGWTGNDTLNGGSDHDTLLGWSGNDSLNGGDGNDVLRGEAGNDTLTGGAGADTFAFNSLSDKIDIITDFKYYEGDTIQISSSGFGTNNPDLFFYSNSTGALSFAGQQFATLQAGLGDGFIPAYDITFV